MDRVDKVHRGARHLVFKDGLRTLFPACQGTLPAKMVRVLERLDDDKQDAPAIRPSSLEDDLAE
jgi:hypothetical protein